MFHRRVSVTHRGGLPFVVRDHSTTRSALGVIGRCVGSKVCNKVVRYFSCDGRVTERCLGVKLCLKVNKIIAFGGSQGLGRITRCTPLGRVLLRASYPCVTPIPGHKGEGDSLCLPRIIGAVTRVGKVDYRRIITIARDGTLGILGLVGLKGDTLL